MGPCRTTGYCSFYGKERTKDRRKNQRWRKKRTQAGEKGKVLGGGVQKAGRARKKTFLASREKRHQKEKMRQQERPKANPRPAPPKEG